MMRNPIEIGSIKFDLYRDTGFSFVGAKNQGTHHYSDARRAYTNGYSNGLANAIRALLPDLLKVTGKI